MSPRGLWLLVLGGPLVHLLAAAAAYLLTAGAEAEPLVRLAYLLKAFDARTYHYAAEDVLHFWTHHQVEAAQGWIDVPRVSLLWARLYQFLPAHPLTIAAVNALSFAGTGWAVWRLAALAGRPPSRRLLAGALVVLWPSAVAWSLLPLKESLSLLGAAVFLAALLTLLRDRRVAWPALAGWVAALAATVLLLVYLRFYFARVLLWMALVPMVTALAAALWRRRRPSWGREALVLAGILLGLTISAPYHQDLLVIYPPEKADQVRDEQEKARAQKSEQVEGMVSGMVPKVGEALKHQQHFIEGGGRSLRAQETPDPQPPQGPAARLWRLIADAPRALADLLLFPYPWQRWPASPSWNYKNLLVSAYGVLWYALLPGLLFGLGRAVAQRPVVGLTLAAWSLGLGLALSVVAVNLGTLFRLRDMLLLPALAVWDPAPYLWAWRRLRPGRAGGGSG
jgi:hypothetical protein